jgi:hypothetical protein
LSFSNPFWFCSQQFTPNSKVLCGFFRHVCQETSTQANDFSPDFLNKFLRIPSEHLILRFTLLCYEINGCWYSQNPILLQNDYFCCGFDWFLGSLSRRFLSLFSKRHQLAFRSLTTKQTFNQTLSSYFPAWNLSILQRVSSTIINNQNKWSLGLLWRKKIIKGIYYY